MASLVTYAQGTTDAQANFVDPPGRQNDTIGKKHLVIDSIHATLSGVTAWTGGFLNIQRSSGPTTIIDFGQGMAGAANSTVVIDQSFPGGLPVADTVLGDTLRARVGGTGTASVAVVVTYHYEP